MNDSNNYSFFREGKMKNILIHKKQITKEITAYYFTKSKNCCLRVEYNKSWDFGKSSSGAHLDRIEIHYRNSWVKDELIEIKLDDVPSVIVDVLGYLIYPKATATKRIGG